MKIRVDVETRTGGRSGIEARSPDLGLTSHGIDEQEALKSLKRGIVAWCNGLQSLDRLERALKGKRLHWEADGKDIEIDLRILARHSVT